MKFTGVSKKTGVMIILVYMLVVVLTLILFNDTVSFIVLAVGMMLSGITGLKIKSYAFFDSKYIMLKNANTYNKVILYMNYLLIFLGLTFIIQQF